MSISVSTSQASIVGIYEALNMQIQPSRAKDAEGHYQTVYTLQIPYARTDYVVDAQGNKMAIVPHDPVMPTPGQDPYFGNVYVDAATLAPIMAAAASGANQDWLLKLVDEMIEADLEKRKILPSPTA